MKQLLIIVYKINVRGLSHQRVEDSMKNMIENMSLTQDKELKENYHIREIWLPCTDDETDVKVIYPIKNDHDCQSKSELDHIYKKIYEYIEENPDSEASKEMKKIIRTIKIKNIDGINEK